MNKQQLILEGFFDELNKTAGFFSKMLKGVYKGVSSPKVKSKIIEHADDIAVVGTGAAGTAYYLKNKDRGEEKTTVNTETKVDPPVVVEDVPDSTENKIINPVKPPEIETPIDTSKNKIVNISTPADSSKVVIPPAVKDTVSVPKDTVVTKPPTKSKPRKDVYNLYNRISTVSDSLDQEYKEKAKTPKDTTTKTKVPPTKPPVTTNSQSKVDSIMNAIKEKYGQ